MRSGVGLLCSCAEQSITTRFVVFRSSQFGVLIRTTPRRQDRVSRDIFRILCDSGTERDDMSRDEVPSFRKDRAVRTMKVPVPCHFSPMVLILLRRFFRQRRDTVPIPSPFIPSHHSSTQEEGVHVPFRQAIKFSAPLSPHPLPLLRQVTGEALAVSPRR